MERFCDNTQQVIVQYKTISSLINQKKTYYESKIVIHVDIVCV